MPERESDGVITMGEGEMNHKGQGLVTPCEAIRHTGKSASAHSVGVDVSFARTGIFNPLEDVSDLGKAKEPKN